MAKLIYFCGHAGTGKTTLARRAVARLHAATGESFCLLDKDTLYGTFSARVMGLLTGDPNDRDSPTYLDHLRDQEYAVCSSRHRELALASTCCWSARFARGQVEARSMRARRAADTHISVIWWRSTSHREGAHVARGDARSLARALGRLCCPLPTCPSSGAAALRQHGVRRRCVRAADRRHRLIGRPAHLSLGRGCRLRRRQRRTGGHDTRPYLHKATTNLSFPCAAGRWTFPVTISCGSDGRQFVQLIQLAINGISAGAIYSPSRSDWCCLPGDRSPNFAHGDLLMLTVHRVGMIEVAGLPFWLLPSPSRRSRWSPAARSARHAHHRGQPQFAGVMLTIGLAFMIRGAVSMGFGPESRTYATPWTGKTTRVGGLVIADLNLVIIVSALLVTLALFYFLRRSALGIAVQAASQNQLAAYLSGIRVKRLNSLVWGLSGAISATGGLLLAPIALVTSVCGS
jgi:branched-chain amino acid transport system permease protein